MKWSTDDDDDDDDVFGDAPLPSRTILVVAVAVLEVGSLNKLAVIDEAVAASVVLCSTALTPSTVEVEIDCDDDDAEKKKKNAKHMRATKNNRR